MREPLLNIAIEAARNAGNLLVRAVQRLDTVKVAEKAPNDFVSDLDQKVEQDIINAIRKAYPNHAIVGEESGMLAGTDAEYQWVIDPIDGTRNFIHGFPHFAISIAILHKNRIEQGLIYDPLRQELFTASRGKGAFLNDRRIRVGTCKTLEKALIGTGFAHRYQDDNNLNATYSRILQSVLPICGDIRRAGAATLDLAYVACGRLDGYWELGLKLWDLAAGVLLVKEAGGLVCDPEGGESFTKTGNVIAASPLVMRSLLKVVKEQCESTSITDAKE